MRMRAAALAILGGVFLFACQKNNPSSSPTPPSPVTQSPFSKTVGGPVSGAVARNWTANLERKRRGEVSSFTLPAAVVRQLLDAPAAVGILFYHGWLADKALFIPVALTAAGKTIPAPTIYTTAGLLSWEAARAAKRAYTRGPEKAFFQGANGLKELLATGATTIRIAIGLDELGGEKIYFSDAAVENPDLVLDRNFICPPDCPKESETSF